GANAMRGVANNLSAALADTCERKGYARVADRTAAPLSEALALIVRERLTGLAPPAAAKGLVDIWRGEIEQRAGASLDKLSGVAVDQALFAQVARDLIRDLDVYEDAGDEYGKDDSEEEGESETPPPQDSAPEGEEDGEEQQAPADMQALESEKD